MPRNCTVRRAFTGHRVGESHQRAELTSEDITLIRTLNKEHKIGYGTLGKKFETPKSTIADICTYKRRIYE